MEIYTYVYIYDKMASTTLVGPYNKIQIAKLFLVWVLHFKSFFMDSNKGLMNCCCQWMV